MVQTLDFRTDQATRGRMDERSLAEVGANLWADACATCHRPLGSRRPALCVATADSTGRAGLHHFSCRHPQWEEADSLPAGQSADYRARAFLLHGSQGGTAQTRPALLVNPSLGQVMLTRRAGRWRVATVENAGALGLRAGPDLVIGDGSGVWPVARIRGGSLSAAVPAGAGAPEWSTPEWSAPLDGAVLRRVRELRGVLLGVTSAVRPDQLATVADVMPAINAGRVALGWIPLQD